MGSKDTTVSEPDGYWFAIDRLVVVFWTFSMRIYADTVKFYEILKVFIEATCLWQSEQLASLMPYKMEIPRHPSARVQIVNELCDTCERRALTLFKALTWLLPGPLMALYVTATCDGTLILLTIARFLVDGDMPWYNRGKCPSLTRTMSGDKVMIPPSRLSSRRSKLSANGLVLFGVFIHVFQFLHFYNRTLLISSPYGFCSNIFVFLVTGFTSYSFWCTVVVCIVKNFLISILYLTLQPSLNENEIAYFYAYWCSCAIVLTVLTPVYLETIGRIIAEGQAITYKKHMNDLLRASFDACVWVDNKLCVVEAEPKLDLMFMQTMKQRSLMEFVKQPECDKFEMHVTASIENHSTSLHHVTFATSDIHSFDVDLYITSKLSYWLRDGQHHLVGIRIRNPPPETQTLKNSATKASHSDDSWECPECHCVNFEAVSLAEPKYCILCGFTGIMDYGCGTIYESDDDELNYPHSEVSLVWQS